MSAIAIAANFTAEPVGEVLEFWSTELSFGLDVAFAPYDQVFQELLSPTGLFASNAGGVNVVLLKLDRWARTDGDDAPDAASLMRIGEELAAAIRGAANRTGAPHIVAICPPTNAATPDVAVDAAVRRAETALVDALAAAPHVHLVSRSETLRLYPVAAIHDEAADELGAIPYTESFFAAVGTMIARQVRALRTTPYKVLALDCDNTIWNGIVGELGADGIALDDAALALQRLAVRQQQSGALVCLCSKNVEHAVHEVLATRDDMILRDEHIVASRINWEPKSSNLRSLAAALDLGLDSFVFLDDSAYEIAEVRENASDVVALQIPENAGDRLRFLDHCWLFDRPAATDEDRRRTAFYQENAFRDAELQQSTTLDDFLHRLELEVGIDAPAPADFARAAQMTQRTTQFNATTIRRTEQELRQLVESNALECRLVRVRDRFGDYGVVGLLLYAPVDDALRVDTLLLSCRALGRRVEHRMVAELGRIARARGLRNVVIPFTRTRRNAPALTFLTAVAAVEAPVGDEHLFSLSADDAASAVSRITVNVEAPTDTRAAPAAGSTAADIATRMTRIATELSDADRIAAAARRLARERAGGVAARGDAATTADEVAILDIWRALFARTDVGVTDNFFDLGGTSLAAVPMFAQLRRRFGAHLSPTMLFGAPTVRELAAAIRVADPASAGAAADWTSLVPIQPAGARPPLFCMHAGAGSILFYYPLARALGTDQPFYALQAQGMNGRDTPHESLGAMAAHYLREIRTVQPTGPYRLAGFCLGATLAFEMTRQLQAEGESVALLASFDGIAPTFAARSGLPAGTAPPLFTRARERLARRMKQMRNRALLRYKRRRGGPVPVVFRRLGWYFLVNNHLALLTYRPQPVAGTMHVFMTRDRYTDARLGWERWVEGSVETHVIDGELHEHRDLLGEPMVRSVARVLASLLVAVDPAQAPPGDVAMPPAAHLPTDDRARAPVAR